MAKEPFDISRLLPHGVTRIKVEVRLTAAEVTIRIFAAEEHADRPSKAPLGKAVLWREDPGPVLISVPVDVQVVAIDADAHE
jgi:glyoxylate carboligase